MRVLLDTHFLLWIVLESTRLDVYPWLDDYRPWGVSPVSLLEIQFLSEIGRVEVRQPEFADALGNDPRFALDEPPLLSLVQRAIELGWTRDPFDRLLAAHSAARRVPLCTVDRVLIREHDLVVRELSET